MSEPKIISPLLDGFVMGGAISSHDGVNCYPAMKENSDNKYIVKIISIPASQVQLEALLLTGAYKDAASATQYFKELSEGIVRETEILQELAKLEGFLPYEGCQIAPMENNRLGYNVYLVSDYKRSVEKFMRRNPMTHLGAVNLGLDLCAAMAACRRAGYLYVDLKPSNIFISEDKEYRVGDLGFVSMDSLKYASLPSKYISSYTAPEMLDALATLNTTIDTYAIGMILYQIYNDGKLPFENHAPAEVLPPPVNADYEMAEIIAKACNPDPQKRWEDPTQMGQALVAYMQRNEVNDTPILPPVISEIPLAADPVETKQEDTEDDLLEGNPAVAPAAIPVVPMADETIPSAESAEGINSDVVTEEVSSMLDHADDLISHNTPEGVIAPEPVDVRLPKNETYDDEEDYDDDYDEDEDYDDEDEYDDDYDDEDEEDSPAPVKQSKPFFAKRPKAEPQPVVSNVDEDDEEDEDEDDEEDIQPKKKSRSWIAVLVIILVVSLLCGGVYYYYNNFYLLPVDSMEVHGFEDQLTVEVVADIDESLLTVVCTDTYGNTQQKGLSNGQAVFTELTPGTTYKLHLEIEGFHKLVNTTSCSYSTPKQINIVSFTAITGAEDGSVALSFTVDGADANQAWNIVYSTEGEEEKTAACSGHSANINGLTVGKTYTFRLVPATELYMVGTDTLEFTASKLILAESLQIVSCNNGELVAQWSTPADATVTNWKVRCYTDDGYDNSVTTAENTATFTEIDGTKAYTVEVTAEGMMQSTRTYITANPITITAVRENTEHAPDLTIEWDYSGVPAEDGWLVLYSLAGSEKQDVIKCTEASATITKAIPGAQYNLQIQSANGATVFGGSYTYSSPAAEPYWNEDYMVGAKVMEASLCKTPDKENWTFRDVADGDYTTNFASGESAAIMLKVEGGFYPYNAGEIQAMFVIRNAAGDLVTTDIQTLTWKNLWTNYKPAYCGLKLPNMPTEAGEYTVDLYFDGGTICTLKFTVS